MKYLCLLIVLTFVAPSFADDKKVSKADEAALKSFRCERFQNTNLSELKLKLVENCNLNKPFSIAATDVALGSSFTYCCNVK